MYRRSPWLRFRVFSHKHGWWGAPILAVFSAILFTWLLIDPTFADPDSFYHTRLAQMMSEQGIITSFSYLRFTYLYQHFTDHHLLYHTFLVPFVKWLPMFVGAKVATVVLAAVFFAVWFSVARRLGGWLPCVAAILMLGTRPMDFRLGLTKASAFALILLFIGFWLIVRKKYVALAFLGFIYAWSHGGFVLLWVVAAVYGVAQVLTEERKHVWALFGAGDMRSHVKVLGKSFWRNALLPTSVAMLGTILGTVINPYFPNNLIFLWQQLVQIGIVNYQATINVGAEWYPYSPVLLAPDTTLMWIALISALVGLAFHWRRINAVSLGSLLLTVFFVIMTLRSRRFVEYLVPWGFMAVTLTWGASEVRELLERNWNKMKRFVWSTHWHTFLSGLLIFYFLVMLPAIMIRGVLDNKREFKDSIPWSRWTGPAAWLTEHTPEGSLVFHDDWDGFPVLFAHDPHNTYVIGLDPTFMYLYDPNLYTEYAAITTGEKEGQLAQLIGQDFGAHYVFVDTDHARFQNQLRRDQAFEEVYKDDEASVFLLK